MRAIFTIFLFVMSSSVVVADEIVLAHDASEKLVAPFGIAFDDKGTLYFVEMAKGERLRKIVDGKVMTIAGVGEKGDTGDGGIGLKAKFNGMHSLAFGSNGFIYLADTWNNRIRIFDTQKYIVSKYAGTGVKGYQGDDGPAAEAQFGGVFCVATDPNKNFLYVTDLDNRRIRKIDLKKQTVATVAGNGQKGVPADGTEAVRQPLVDPRAAAVDSKGRLYILERGGHALRMVDEKGTISTVAGTGKAGRNGLGGPALETSFNGPKHLCIDRDDTVIIADTENHRIVRYVPGSKKLEPVAGSGKKGANGVPGPASDVELFQPHGVTVHPKTGVLYIADSGNNRILKVVK